MTGQTADAGLGSKAPTRRAAPPRWWFHSALLGAALVLLWSQSVPGDDPLWVVVALVSGFVLGVLWLVRLVIWSGGDRRHGGWLLVAPAMTVVVVALLAADVPLKARFDLSRDDFDAAVATLPSEARSGGPTRIGSYDISSWRRTTKDEVIFDEAHGSFLDDAGFAYLPDGPTPGLANSNFENPQFTDLGGGWFAWTASW